MSTQQAAALEQAKLDSDNARPEDRQPSGGVFPTGGRTVGAGIDEQSVASFWFDDGVRYGGVGVIPSRRTSLIVDPPDDFDDPMHGILGVKDRKYQDLYHFTIGGPIEDTRLTTLPSYLDK